MLLFPCAKLERTISSSIFIVKKSADKKYRPIPEENKDGQMISRAFSQLLSFR
jgi:hypothetical protein